MKPSRLVKNKIRLIYASPFTYLMMLFQISFPVIYIYAYKVTAVSSYFNLLKKDLFLWIIYIPVMVVQHKVSVYSTYYSCISRIGSKRRMIFADYVTLAVSTCISTCIVLSAPLFLLRKDTAIVSPEMLFAFFFLLARYLLLGLLVQYIIYSIMYAFPSIQKRGGSICVLPFLLYFVLTTPMEFLVAEGQYLPILDFSAGRNYVFVMDGVVLWGSIFSYNIHLVGCLALHIWITVCFLSKRWEFWENESVEAL